MKKAMKTAQNRFDPNVLISLQARWNWLLVPMDDEIRALFKRTSIVQHLALSGIQMNAPMRGTQRNGLAC